MSIRTNRPKPQYNINMQIVALFNCAAKTGKTTLAYHIAWMLTELGHRTLLADFDPQAHLSAMALGVDKLEAFWSDPSNTLSAALNADDARIPHTEPLADGLSIIVGDPCLAECEEALAGTWRRCMRAHPSALRRTTMPSQIMRTIAQREGAEFVIVDLASNLGALTRATLLAADYILIPATATLLSLRALSVLGPTLLRWRADWERVRAPIMMTQPYGAFAAAGYVLTGPPDEKYQAALEAAYSQYLPAPGFSGSSQLCRIQHYPGLRALAARAGKPMFALQPADGAMGAYAESVQDCYKDFRRLADAIISLSAAYHPEQQTAADLCARQTTACCSRQNHEIGPQM